MSNGNARRLSSHARRHLPRDAERARGVTHGSRLGPAPAGSRAELEAQERARRHPGQEAGVSRRERQRERGCSSPRRRLARLCHGGSGDRLVAALSKSPLPSTQVSSACDLASAARRPGSMRAERERPRHHRNAPIAPLLATGDTLQAPPGQRAASLEGLAAARRQLAVRCAGCLTATASRAMTSTARARDARDRSLPTAAKSPPIERQVAGQRDQQPSVVRERDVAQRRSAAQSPGNRRGAPDRRRSESFRRSPATCSTASQSRCGRAPARSLQPAPQRRDRSSQTSRQALVERKRQLQVGAQQQPRLQIGAQAGAVERAPRPRRSRRARRRRSGFRAPSHPPAPSGARAARARRRAAAPRARDDARPGTATIPAGLRHARGERQLASGPASRLRGRRGAARIACELELQPRQPAP